MFCTFLYNTIRSWRSTFGLLLWLYTYTFVYLLRIHRCGTGMWHNNTIYYIRYVIFANGIRSHAHTVVWECCKDDQRSQWEMLQFDPQLPLNPLSDRHQIWHAWLRHGYLPPRKIGLNPLRGFFSPYTRNIHPHVRYPMFTTFLVLPIAYSRDAVLVVWFSHSRPYKMF